MSFWDEIVSTPTKTADLPKINAKIGAHNAYFIGFGEPYDDPFNERDKKTGAIKQVINLKYEMPDGSIEQEPVTAKISEPSSFYSQSEKKTVTISASKLHERLQTLSGLVGPPYGPGDLGRWAKANQTCRIPVTVIIKQPGKYPKITEVVARQEDGFPGSGTASPFRKVLDTVERNTQASTAQKGAEDGLFDDDDPAFR